MSYFTEIFERANLQNISAFLRHGVGYNFISDKTYQQRMEEASDKVMALIEDKFPAMDENEAITSEIYAYIETTESVYLEVGLQCGVALATQFFRHQ